MNRNDRRTLSLDAPFCFNGGSCWITPPVGGGHGHAASCLLDHFCRTAASKVPPEQDQHRYIHTRYVHYVHTHINACNLFRYYRQPRRRCMPAPPPNLLPDVLQLPAKTYPKLKQDASSPIYNTYAVQGFPQKREPGYDARLQQLRF